MPRPGDKRHLDEAFISIDGEQRYLWRAVDREGDVPDTLVRRRRARRAAKELSRRPLERLAYVPRVVITARLGSRSVEHARHKGLNNRAESAHRPARERERRMRRSGGRAAPRAAA